jgi:hypothetical protein
MDPSDVPYGPVYITEGPHAGRIGYYDDEGVECPEDLDWDDLSEDDDSEGIHVGYVYLGGSL